MKPAGNPTPRGPRRRRASRRAQAIVDALPPVGRSRVGAKLRATLVAGIAAKLADEWQPDDITDELTRDLDTARTTGVYAHRLADMPTQPPRRRTSTAPPRQSGLQAARKCEDEGTCYDHRRPTTSTARRHPLPVPRAAHPLAAKRRPERHRGPKPRRRYTEAGHPPLGAPRGRYGLRTGAGPQQRHQREGESGARL